MYLILSAIRDKRNAVFLFASPTNSTQYTAINSIKGTWINPVISVISSRCDVARINSPVYACIGHFMRPICNS